MEKDLKGSLVETILDWRPFDYFTSESVEGKYEHTPDLHKLEPISDGVKTRLHILTVMISPALPRLIRRPMLRMMLSKMLLTHCQAVANYIAQEMEVDNSVAQAAA
jgi:hypothetical protein